MLLGPAHYQIRTQQTSSVVAAPSSIACEDLNKQKLTVDRTTHSLQAAGGRNTSLHASLAAISAWVVNCIAGIMLALAWRGRPGHRVGLKSVLGLLIV